VTRIEETVERQPNLPRGWERIVNLTAGINFGRPPGWDLADDGVLTVIRAPDELVVLSITIDRTTEAIAASPRAFVAQTASLLPGYETPLDFTGPRSFRHHYQGAVVQATGRADRVRQRVRVIALRRKGVAMITAVVAENAKVGAPREVRQALASLRTLRTQPVS
jgi:hypothetical protein